MKNTTLRAPEYAGSEDYPGGVYNGHDLNQGKVGTTVWAVGETPEAAIRALCEARLGEFGGELPDGPDSPFDWGYAFTANGTGCKASGINVPGGVVLTWWK